LPLSCPPGSSSLCAPLFLQRVDSSSACLVRACCCQNYSPSPALAPALLNFTGLVQPHHTTHSSLPLARFPPESPSHLPGLSQLSNQAFGSFLSAFCCWDLLNGHNPCYPHLHTVEATTFWQLRLFTTDKKFLRADVKSQLT
jgi:hypothetical protein